MKGREKGSIELFEEAIYLLRRAPGTVIAAYYAGSLPFILGLLFFWADMSQSAFAYEHCAPAALGLAVLYYWMLYAQSAFVQGLRAELCGTKRGGWLSAESWRSALPQFALQPFKFMLLPVAALTVVPYASAHAFFHNLMADAPEERYGISRAASAARKQASRWQRQNWTILVLFTLVNAVVFLNTGLAILMMPFLLKTMLGIETVFSRSGGAIVNSTLVAVTAGLTYLVTNPLAKAVYLLRCFYGESLETGQDLRAELKAAAASLALVGMLVAGSMVAVQIAHAQEQPPGQATIEQLNQAIDNVIHRPEFTWRLPRQPRPTNRNSNWFVRMTEEFLSSTGRALRQVGRWVDEFLRWLSGKLRSILPGNAGAPGPDSLKLRLLLIALLSAVVLILGWLLWRVLRQRKLARAVAAAAIVLPAADLHSDDLQADERPADQWLDLARECMARQEYRLALRALYLSGLAHLDNRALIAIHRGKSNQDYARELGRKAKSKPELAAVFAENLSVFERTWYGMYDVNPATVERFQANLEQMRACAE